MAYDPNGWRKNRKNGLQRLANVAYARQQREAGLQQKLGKQEEQQALDNTRGAYGMMGQGAAIGSAAGPWGAGIGALAGLGLGGFAEAKSRQRIHGGSFMSNLGQSLGRAPSMQEIPGIAAGAMGGLGAYKASQAPKMGGGLRPGMSPELANSMATKMNSASSLDNDFALASAPYQPSARASAGMPDMIMPSSSAPAPSELDMMKSISAKSLPPTPEQMGPPSSLALPPQLPGETQTQYMLRLQAMARNPQGMGA